MSDVSPKQIKVKRINSILENYGVWGELRRNNLRVFQSQEYEFYVELIFKEIFGVILGMWVFSASSEKVLVIIYLFILLFPILHYFDTLLYIFIYT